MKHFVTALVWFIVSLVIEYVALPFIILLYCIFVDFNPYYQDIGNGYYYSSDKEYGVDEIVFDLEDRGDKSVIMTFHGAQGDIRKDTLDSYHKGLIVVPRHVTSFANDDAFILCERKPREKFDSLYHDYLVVDSNNSFDGYRNDYEAFRDGYDEKDFWIICQKTNDVYGPLTWDEYMACRSVLNVPDNLSPYEDPTFPLYIVLLILVPILLSLALAIWRYRHSKKV